MATVDFGLQELLNKLDKVADPARMAAVRKRTLKRVGARALKRVKSDHPKITGNMRRNWTCEADDTRAVIDNAVHYAPYVNYGHRRGKGFVRGKFMLEKTLGQAAKSDLKLELERAMKDILGEF